MGRLRSRPGPVCFVLPRVDPATASWHYRVLAHRLMGGPADPHSDRTLDTLDRFTASLDHGGLGVDRAFTRIVQRDLESPEAQLEAGAVVRNARQRGSVRLALALHCESHGVAAAAAVVRVASLLEAEEAQERGYAVHLDLADRLAEVPTMPAVKLEPVPAMLNTRTGQVGRPTVC